MSESEMNSYRFSSGEEPSDEMLAQLMKEVAEEAREKNAVATQNFLSQMRRDIEQKQLQWGDKIKAACDAN